MLDDQDIIEVEVLSEKPTEPAEPSKPHKAESDHSAAVHFYAKASQPFIRFGEGTFLLFAIVGLAFSILYSQSLATYHLVFMIIAWSLCFLALISFIIGFILNRMMVHYMKMDPNFEQYVR